MRYRVPATEMSTRNISWGLRWPVRRADNLTTFKCRLSWNLGASTSWNPHGLSRSVMELIYLFFTFVVLVLMVVALLAALMLPIISRPDSAREFYWICSLRELRRR